MINLNSLTYAQAHDQLTRWGWNQMGAGYFCKAHNREHLLWFQHNLTGQQQGFDNFIQVINWVKESIPCSLDAYRYEIEKSEKA